MLNNVKIIAKIQVKNNLKGFQKLQSWIEKHSGGYRYLKDDVIIYPSVFFAPFDHLKLKPLPVKNTYTVHHFAGSWKDRTKIPHKKYNINLEEIFEDRVFWQMSYSERVAANYLFDKLNKKNTAIEIGSYFGGLTSILSKKFNKIYSLDIDHSNIFGKEFYNNVTWIEGDSKRTLPSLIDKINKSDEIINFILVDADHEYDGVYSDLSNILKIKPKDDLVILIHDSWYTPSRQAICNIPWNDNQYIHFIDTDYVCGDVGFIAGKNQYIGGFCLIIMSPEKREKKLEIKQSHDYMYCTVNRTLGNMI
jgi:hypothetical protein